MIYICIPTYNEQQTVGVVLWKLRHVLTEFHRDYQLLVADDASTDRTADVLEPYTRVLPLTVIRSESRQGHAASLEMLLREAVRRSEYPKRDAIVTIQADFSDEPDDIVPLIKRIEAGADVAVGNKVSSSRDRRSRRAARWLAAMFGRGMKWPDGVTNPFDGYRAYRLYAVKRAIEDRAGRRLIRFAGWTGHAELLRAVLPHTRRVDVVNVDDRRDRLQRATRERAFAAAFHVRSLSRDTDPAGLVGVDELDRIAATASRSRERASQRTIESRSNGAHTRSGRDRADGRKQPRSRTNGARTSGRGEREAGRERTQEGGRSAAPRPAKAATKKAARSRKSRQAEETAQEAVAELESSLDGVAPATGQPESRPKRKRRRRRKSSQSEATTGLSQAADPADMGSEAGVEAPEASASGPDAGTSEAADGGTEKKRRRRSGRRGGRGRRRPRAGAAPDGGNDGADGNDGPVSPVAARMESDQEQA